MRQCLQKQGKFSLSVIVFILLFSTLGHAQYTDSDYELFSDELENPWVDSQIIEIDNLCLQSLGKQNPICKTLLNRINNYITNPEADSFLICYTFDKIQEYKYKAVIITNDLLQFTENSDIKDVYKCKALDTYIEIVGLKNYIHSFPPKQAYLRAHYYSTLMSYCVKYKDKIPESIGDRQDALEVLFQQISDKNKANRNEIIDNFDIVLLLNIYLPIKEKNQNYKRFYNRLSKIKNNETDAAIRMKIDSIFKFHDDGWFQINDN